MDADGQGEAASKLRMAKIEQRAKNPVFYADEALALLKQNLPKQAREALAVLDLAERRGLANDYTKNIRNKVMNATR